MLFRFEQLHVHFAAYPRVGSRIHLLGGGQFISLPVGELLGLGDAAAQDYGRHLLHALVPDPPLAHYLLEVHEILSLELAVVLEAAHVVMHGRADLDYVGIGKHGAHQPAHAQLVDPEQIGLVRP